MTDGKASFHRNVVPLVLAIALFAIVSLDLGWDLDLLDTRSVVVLGAVLIAALAVLLRQRVAPHRGAALVLLLGALASVAIRAVRHEESVLTSPDSRASERDRDVRRDALSASKGFAALCQAAQRAASRLASEPALAEALELTDPEALSPAFSLLAISELPRVERGGAPGVTLFDASLRPIAWAGENRPLERLPGVPHGVPRAALLVIRRSVETSVVAVHPVGSAEGLVAVEVPIAADRRLENRYLEDYDAISDWAGRSVEVDFPSSDAEKEEARKRFEREGDPHWGGDVETPRLFFGLSSPDEGLLGIGSIAAEPPQAAVLEERRRLALSIAFALVSSSALALLFFLRSRPGIFLLIPAIWGFRLVLHASHLPLGLALGLDNPADYASSLFFGLARSPADFLATMAGLLASAWMIFRFVTSRRILPRRLEALRLLGPPVTLLLFAGVNQVVLDAWRNSNLALAEVLLASSDPPRLTVQLGLLALFLSATYLGYLLLAPRTKGRNAALWLGLDLLLVIAAFYAFSSRGYGDHVLLAAIPLLGVHLLALHPRRIRAGLSSLVLLVAAVGLFYPSVARFESLTIRDFIENTVSPALLQHRSSPQPVLVRTAMELDAMYQEGRFGDLTREDLAFAIWVATELSASSLSSSVEIVDPARRIVSRFGVSFPPLALPHERTPAPRDWIKEEGRFPAAPEHPGFMTARRTFAEPGSAPWEVRIRVAADWRNLPFIATIDPYLRLFRASAVEARRFPHQELELTVMTHSGRAVFQSVGETPQPEEEILSGALESPTWWEHPHEDQTHRTYLVGDEDYLYALSYPEKTLATYGAELALWLLLAAILAVLALAILLLLHALGSEAGIDPSDLLAGVRASFPAKLYAAFVLVALVPIASLAFLIHGIVILDLERGVEREAFDRARVAERLVHELHSSGPASALGTAPVTDSVLEQVSQLASVDVDLYIGGELLATSKPELVGSGLLGTRAAPSAQREIVVERRSHSLHRESVGTFPYLVVSVPIVLEPWTEPGILSIPLASRQPEIDRKVASLNQTVLLAAVAFSALAALLAYTLARRIAGPINQLTEATHAVAEGSREVSLETSARDEIGKLFSSFNRMTADLKRQREDLETSKKLEAWAEMARQVAHEVKNPITPIQLAAEHLRRVYGDPDVDFEKVLQQCTETILQQVKTLRQISMEFSTFASPGPLELEPTDVSSLVRETMSPYVQAPPPGVSLRVHADPGLPEAPVDRRLLRRTLVNLVENALHALNGKGRIEVRVSSASQNGSRFVEVRVKDDGIGIEAELKARVFEPYFSTRAAGTGLGLAIAKKVVEDHGGTIGLESEPGRGTEVTIRLPASTRGREGGE